MFGMWLRTYACVADVNVFKSSCGSIQALGPGVPLHVGLLDTGTQVGVS